jgi:hypothetical protein
MSKSKKKDDDFNLDKTEEKNTLPEKPPLIHPTEELMMHAITAWKMDTFKNMFYRMNRTFCHFRLNEKYGTHIIFEELDQLNKGRHQELLDQMNAFANQVMNDLKVHLAAKDSTK